MGGESHEIRDDKLLAESLGQEHDVALDTSDEGKRKQQDDDDDEIRLHDTNTTRSLKTPRAQHVICPVHHLYSSCSTSHKI